MVRSRHGLCGLGDVSGRGFPEDPLAVIRKLREARLGLGTQSCLLWGEEVCMLLMLSLVKKQQLFIFPELVFCGWHSDLVFVGCLDTVRK